MCLLWIIRFFTCLRVMAALYRMADGVRWLPLDPLGNRMAPVPSSLSSTWARPTAPLLPQQGESGLLEKGSEAASSLAVSLLGGVSSNPAPPAVSPPRAWVAPAPLTPSSTRRVEHSRSGLEEDSFNGGGSSWPSLTTAPGVVSVRGGAGVVVLGRVGSLSRLAGAEECFAAERSPLLPRPLLRWRVFTLRARLGDVGFAQGGTVTWSTPASILGRMISDLRRSGLIMTNNSLVNETHLLLLVGVMRSDITIFYKECFSCKEWYY